MIDLSQFTQGKKPTKMERYAYFTSESSKASTKYVLDHFESWVPIEFDIPTITGAPYEFYYGDKPYKLKKAIVDMYRQFVLHIFVLKREYEK